MIAHRAGVPLAEFLTTLAGATGMLLLARGWLALFLHRRRDTAR